ncbi:MAG: glycosyltransferase family 2 protein [Endomicrobiia bacterium]
MIDLSITIVNYNTKDLLSQCIKSIYHNTKEISYEIIVVDNASSDGSVEMLKKEFPEVIVIANNKNLFFTRAHNQALRIANGRYLMILNSDTVILERAFDKMIKFMDEHPECGACVPKLLNPDMTLQRSSDRLPTFTYGLFEVLLLNTLFPNNSVKRYRIYSEWDRNSTMAVDSVGGSCMMVRREVIEKIGLLDENFLAYWEEIDWCKRILEAGYKIYYLHTAQIIHCWQVSMNKLGKEKKEKIFYNSMLYYYKKHFGMLTYWIFRSILVFSMFFLYIFRKIKMLIFTQSK